MFTFVNQNHFGKKKKKEKDFDLYNVLLKCILYGKAEVPDSIARVHFDSPCTAEIVVIRERVSRR